MLDNILFLNGILVYIQDLTIRMNTMRMLDLLTDPKYHERLRNLYGVEFFREEEGNKDREESRRLEKREDAL